MNSNDEFPGAVDLSVGGVKYRVLLSTLQKDRNSVLGQMFLTGQIPAHKDSSGRYHIEANGSTFYAILYYLAYDDFPFHEFLTSPFGASSSLFRAPTDGGVFGNVGKFGGPGSENVRLSPADLRAIYADAVNLRLSSLVKRLEQYQAIFIEKNMKEYRESIGCYDDILNRILSKIPPDVVFYDALYTVRVEQDVRATYQEKCCEHECIPLQFATNMDSIDLTVKVPCELSLTMLPALTKDLQQLGYCVQGLVSSCRFTCKKEARQSKYGLFSDPVKNCCFDKMLLLVFKFNSNSDVIIHPKGFGQKWPVFGHPNSNTGFSFGKPTTGQGFFDNPFGSNKQQSFGASCFGQSQQAGNSFSFGAQNQQGLGSQQPQGFGSQQPQGFDSQPQGFGSQQQQGFGDNNNVGFQNQQQQQQQSSPNAFSFSNTGAKTGNGAFGGFGSSQSSQSVFGKTSGLFGSTDTSGGQKSPLILQKSSFGSSNVQAQAKTGFRFQQVSQAGALKQPGFTFGTKLGTLPSKTQTTQQFSGFSSNQTTVAQTKTGIVFGGAPVFASAVKTTTEPTAVKLPVQQRSNMTDKTPDSPDVKKEPSDDEDEYNDPL